MVQRRTNFKVERQRMNNRRQLNGNENDERHELVYQSRPGQVVNARPFVDRLDASTESNDEFAALLQYVQLLWKCKAIVLSAAVMGVLLATALTLRMTPLYKAKTSMQIENIQEPFGNNVNNALPSRDIQLMTQVELLQSLSMRERALFKLRAKRDLPNPKVSGALVSLRSLLGLQSPAAVPWNEALNIAAGSASAKAAKDSRIVEIESRSSNPEAAAAFTDTLAEEYIQRIQEERWDSYQHTGEWLTRAQEELKTKVEQSDARIANFAKSKRLVFTGAQNVSEDKLKQLQTQFLAASADRIARQAAWESSQNSPTESLPSVLDSGPMATYQTKLADLRRELAELSATLTPSHYRTQRVQAQIEELEKERSRERSNIISRIRIEYEAAAKRENELRRSYDEQTQALAGQADDIIQYNILQREAETNKKLYDMALQQGKQASIASALRTSNARIVDRATKPTSPARPNLFLNLSLGLFGGLFCGALFVFVRARMNAKIQAPGVLELHMNLRELGVIPTALNDSGMRLLSRLQWAGNGSVGNRRTKLEGSEDPSDCVELVTWNRKPSVIAEAFRATMTSILFSVENGDGPKVVVITSA